jgi:VWFA-related protein
MRQLLVFLPIAAIAIAQQAKPDATFRVDTELIQTSVIAQDAKGKPVADLKREEFRIFDNGIPQEIRLFDAESETAAPELPGPKRSNVFTNERGPSSGSRRGHAVILIDTLHTDFGDPKIGVEGSGSAISRTRRLLRSMPAGERIAINALQRKLQVICEFTSDRNLLEQRFLAWKVPIDMPVNSRKVMEEALASREEIVEAARIDSLGRISASNDVMVQVADHLAGIPGRKNLIWVADVFPISGTALQKFSDAGVAIYPVDAWGVCPVAPQDHGLISPRARPDLSRP